MLWLGLDSCLSDFSLKPSYPTASELELFAVSITKGNIGDVNRLFHTHNLRLLPLLAGFHMSFTDIDTLNKDALVIFGNDFAHFPPVVSAENEDFITFFDPFRKTNVIILF